MKTLPDYAEALAMALRGIAPVSRSESIALD